MSRILLIDDSEFILELYEEKLDELGHEVESTTDAAAGLKIFFDALHDHARSFQIVITDVEMPVVTGHDVLAQVLRRSPETPVIMLSSQKDPEVVQSALQDGALDYVFKAAGTQALEQAIEAARKQIAETASKHEAARSTSSAGHVTLQSLRELVGQGADGEFIATAEGWEIHVHLQQGKVAWATSSRSKYAFTRHLVDHFGVDKEAILSVVEECQKTRKNVGETLIEWGVCTEEQVRASLQAQIADAIASLAEDTPADTIFLPRTAAYAQPLTFSLEELLAT